ncbi:hypothetical protein B0H67DRAFT_475690 [Lasiosphaeris hirsuta]|uniref:WDR59/RTC1-like RING zinc finger domain-containing protein n=1 Tax=Lasiosphaeris hirsuta TaxID=260670 RepID=A0AA40EC07_9PEZI|nr:hypothetical protein B0H67DRAFT_475690 [Lasiosphaeris hirsuta]
MPYTFDRPSDTPKKGKSIKSAFDSESFDADGTIHVAGLVGSATISPSGRDVALASPDGLAIIDLDSPWSPPRKLSSHGLPWLVVDVQWSPFAARDYWVASTANHRCLVWNLNLRDDSPSGAIEHSLQAHTRAITDINFSAHHPDSLATCAVDGYVNCWDLRRPRQPVLTFCDWFAGATQVKYNRQDPHILASSHDRWLHIWDDRKSAEPLKTISAHTSKIYGLDWNRTQSTSLVTCSLDKSIKFWDYSRADEVPEKVIRTNFPVWRARHTPFGCGLLAMPQNEPGNLYLYDRRPNANYPANGKAEPVAIFQGHGNHKVKEFLWRSRGGVSNDNVDNREFQLVSWGEDNELRLQKVDPGIFESVGYYRGTALRKNLVITRKGAAYKTFRTVDDTVHRDRRSATMSDPRPGSGGQFRSSALSLGLHSRLRRVGPTWRTTSMKANSKTGKSVDKSQLQIGWMKGITMSKRKSSSDIPGRLGSKDSGMFSPGYDGGWGDPETIQDEFLRISTQLPNVKWENIDMDTLTLNASLRGPWGVNQETIFIKVKVDIPASYPKTKAPIFVVEKSSFMPEETHKKIECELRELGSRFLKRRENCLGVAFTYLLGEVDLETSTTFFKNVRDLDDEMDALADESSSEEDEHDIPAGGSASMSQELTGSIELDPTATLASTQRLVIPPLPRYCGARFSNDGRLVCFFPTKEEKDKARALFAVSNADTYRERSKGEPTFAGFGRLAPNSPPPKRRFNDETSATDEPSGESDGSESDSSSGSEPTTVHKISLWYQNGRHFSRKTWSANDSVRSSGAGTGAGTGTGTGASRKRAGKPKNVIAIYDLRGELPSKKQFAQEYAIFGDGADVCKHNAAVAEKYGYLDLVHVWNYAALLLRKDIPLELHEMQRRGESVLVIARDAAARARDEDGESSEISSLDVNLSGRVRWGFHPLAQDLISDLFEYFERVADIQMLAMLACIFGDSSTEDGVAYAESHLTQPETPLPMKAPSFSLEYFPSDPALWSMNIKSQASSAITTPRMAHTPAMYSDSLGSDEIITLIEPGSNSYSCGETPPKSGRDHPHLRDPDHGTHSLSTSPNNRLFHRPNSTVAATIAASLPRTLAGIVSASPPDFPRKRPSPAETILSSTVTWGASTVFGAAPDTPGTARTSLSDDDFRRDEMMPMIPYRVTCIPENQGLFDDDGWMSTPLLSPGRSQMYSSYRYAYAEMLQMWGQPLSRLEIMKFNVLKEDTSSSFRSGTAESYPESFTAADPNSIPHVTTGTTSPTVPFGGRKEQLHALISSGRGLDVTGICRIHEIQLDPVEYSRATNGQVGGAVGICQRCQTARPGSKTPQTQLRCVYCLEPVSALYPPCLNCGCASHEACLAEWHAMGEVECPAGDECNCVHEASNGQVESWPALQAAMAMARMRTGTAAASAVSARHAAAVAAAVALKTGIKPRRRSVPADLTKFGVGFEDEGGAGAVTGDNDPGNMRRVRRTNTAHGRGRRGEMDAADREEWESVASSPGPHTILSGSSSGSSGAASAVGPSLAAGLAGFGLGGGNKPPVQGDEPISAARLSLGNRLKRSLGEQARPGALRRKSGGVTLWKSGAG